MEYLNWQECEEGDYVEVYFNKDGVWDKSKWWEDGKDVVSCIFKYIDTMYTESHQKEKRVQHLIAVVDDVQEQIIDYIIVNGNDIRKEKECE